MTQKMTVRVKKLPNFTGVLPSYATPFSSGFDVRAQIKERAVIAPNERVLLPTGLAFEIPQGMEIQVRPRSGLAIKKALSLINAPGTVDADYRGEVKVILINLGKETVTIKPQDRIAQMVLCPVLQADFKEAKELSLTQRGEGGLGSTGTQ